MSETLRLLANTGFVGDAAIRKKAAVLGFETAILREANPALTAKFSLCTDSERPHLQSQSCELPCLVDSTVAGADLTGGAC